MMKSSDDLTIGRVYFMIDLESESKARAFKWSNSEADNTLLSMNMVYDNLQEACAAGREVELKEPIILSQEAYDNLIYHIENPEAPTQKLTELADGFELYNTYMQGVEIQKTATMNKD